MLKIYLIKIPAIVNKLFWTNLIISINSLSLLPRSRSIACFTVNEVDNGPGVNKSLSPFYFENISLIKIV